MTPPGRPPTALAAEPAAEGEGTVAELREEFDRGFTLAPRPAADPAALSDFILLAAGSGHYALSTSELRGIEHAVLVTPAPSRVPALLGVAGVRGAILPVFSLAGLLGLPADAAEAWWRAPLFAVASVPADGALPGARPTPRDETAMHGARSFPAASSQHSAQLIGFAFDRLLHAVRVPAGDLLHGEHGRSLQHGGELFAVLTAQHLMEPLLASAFAQKSPSENRRP